MHRDHVLHAVDRRLALPTGEDISKADPGPPLVDRREGPAGRGPPLPASDQITGVRVLDETGCPPSTVSLPLDEMVTA